ncbi:hypothetical protein SAMN06295905_0800 [Devosia lucknowensis]|uniref:Response regulatory domain-containing protein n=1 Tax=Devosia lucknowensis TaxID=1096929 RepID=A0A1Y6EQX7_9HYPH|nr:response regulator [Devosia lucknowensis]SMQ63350.1 hypothetical protein SAMN06295905_0800 [Devosia lucknowensis]
MTTTTFTDLRVLIGEDEQLLAFDLAHQLETLGAHVVGMADSVARIEQMSDMQLSEANAAILDVELLDGEVYAVVPRLEAAGIGVVICSGYQRAERPDRFAHIEWVGKPALPEQIAAALCRAVDARKGNPID